MTAAMFEVVSMEVALLMGQGKQEREHQGGSPRERCVGVTVLKQRTGTEQRTRGRYPLSHAE